MEALELGVRVATLISKDYGLVLGQVVQLCDEKGDFQTPHINQNRLVSLIFLLTQLLDYFLAANDADYTRHESVEYCVLADFD